MTNNTNKKTNKEMFTILLALVANANIAETDKNELSDFINSRITQLEKKASTPSKADLAKAELNNRIASDIIAGLTELDKPVKISELIKSYTPLNEFSTQKLTPILSKLVADGKVTKTVVKRDTLYNIV